MITKIFVFGCSYATGEELLMHELGDLDDFRISTKSDPRKFFKRVTELGLQSEYEEIKKRQKKIAWPQQLSDMLNFECINLAESGNSLDKMLYQMYKEIYLGNITADDIIIVSLTKASRNAIFNHEVVESFQLPSLYWPIKNLMGVKDDGDFKPVINESTDMALLDWFTNERIIWDYIKNLQAIKNLKQFFKLHIVPAMKNEIQTKNSVLSQIQQDCNKGFLTQLGLDDFSEKRLAWGHPDIVAHNKYAKHLYEILR